LNNIEKMINPLNQVSPSPLHDLLIKKMKDISKDGIYNISGDITERSAASMRSIASGRSRDLSMFIKEIREWRNKRVIQ